MTISNIARSARAPRSILAGTLPAAITTLAILAVFTAPGARAGELTPALAGELALAAPGEPIPACIMARSAPDIVALRAELLRLETAGEAREIRVLWIAGALAARLTPEAARLLAARSDVAWVDADRPIGMLEASVPAEQAASAPAPPHVASIAWNVAWIGAPAVWASGFDGSGVLVAVLDTGIDYTHTDLAGRMHRNLADPWPPDGIDNDGNGYVDDYYGYDIVNRDRDPRDDNGHGTHCSGTIAGDGTGGIRTGVAPGAELLAVKVIDAGGAGTPSGLVEGMQYAIHSGADVVSIALGWFQAGTATRRLLRAACEGALAEGVPVIALAGGDRGSGPPPDLIRTPGDVPPPWIHPDVESTGSVGGVITVGATGYMSDALANFSSNGPVRWNTISPWYDWDAPYLIKPDVVAPGVDIISTWMGGGYSGPGYSGTAMSTSHVSGLVALMLSKGPDLTPARVDEIMELQSLPLGPPGKDNDYGAGRIRAPETLAAVPDTRTSVRAAGATGPDDPGLDRGPLASLAPPNPNPLGGEGTTLSFRLSAAGPAALRIFDVRGSLVRVLASGRFAAGDAEVSWDGRDAAGCPVASGIYYARLDAAGRMTSRRVAVLR